MKNTFKLLPVLLLTTILFVSCEEFLDVNTDPNNPPTAPIDGLLVRTTLETGRNTYRVGEVTSSFVQYLASPNPAYGPDIHDNISYGAIWSSLYGVLGDLADLRAQAEQQNAPHYAGVGKVLTAYNLSLLVNMFGDVPYSEALFGTTLNPKYDASSDIYAEILRLLDQAVVDLQSTASTSSPGQSDLIFRGDRQKWLRTAHALRARYLNHYSKTSSYNPAAVLAAVDQAFRNSGDDFQLSFFNEGLTTQNPWYRVAVLNAGLNLGGWFSTQLINHMNGTYYGVFDPRLPLIANPVTNLDFPAIVGQYVGTRNGAGRGAVPSVGVRAVLIVGSFYSASATSPIEMATYAELKFIEAEAALAMNPARSAAAYEAGIRSHMAKLGVNQGDINAYMATSEVSTQINRAKIMKEKYVAMLLNPEAWNDARRFNYQYNGFQLPTNHNPALNGQMLRRVRYPDSEFQRNALKVPQRTLLDRIFWDIP
jgi:hypothetical protein